MFPAKTLIRVHHPTGSHGDYFAKVYFSHEQLNPQVEKLWEGMKGENRIFLKSCKEKKLAPDDKEIVLLVKHNPKRPGSKSANRFELYKKNKTVADFLKAGGLQQDLKWDVEHKFIEIKKKEQNEFA